MLSVFSIFKYLSISILILSSKKLCDLILNYTTLLIHYESGQQNKIHFLDPNSSEKYTTVTFLFTNIIMQ